MNPLRLVTVLSLCLAGTFVAQEAAAVGIAGVRLSNDPGEYVSAGEHPFDPSQNVYLYVDLLYGDPQGYQFWAECSIAIDATGERLRRVSISDRIVTDPVVRSSAINMAWPNAWIAISCTPQGQQSFTRTFRFSPELWVRGGSHAAAAAPAAPSYAAAPAPTVVYVPTPSPGAAPAPAPAPTCRETLLSRGHDSFDLSYCDGTNERCAVALLERGHDPFDLSYCRGIRDVDCAVSLLRRGGDPFDLSDCN